MDRRVRVYCPTGDLVGGMAYLVRRMLENTANDSFLRARVEAEDPNALLEAP
jgi:RHH-type proline utilization regulon transcriptional repressor/proline dehydrogenase/delta 1-pyrroline-5-carboxylate dehydrogenase